MTDVMTIVNQLTKICSENQATITRILSKLDDATLDKWKNELKVIDGTVGGTYYDVVGEKLSFNDFRELYTALGYSFLNGWIDQDCNKEDPTFPFCEDRKGYTCDTITHRCSNTNP